MRDYSPFEPVPARLEIRNLMGQAGRALFNAGFYEEALEPIRAATWFGLVPPVGFLSVSLIYEQAWEDLWSAAVDA